MSLKSKMGLTSNNLSTGSSRLTYANFITANFVTAVFQNYYYKFANSILWAIDFVSAFDH